MAILPLETCENIIDYLHSDRQSLYSCSLVCKSWVPVARFHLYEAIELDSRNADYFFRTLDMSPILGDYTRNLNIIEYPKTRWSHDVETSQNLQWVCGVLHILAMRLREVQSLVLHNVNFERLNLEAEDGFVSGFQKVRDLQLCSETTFGSFSQCARIIASFPTLISFSCTASDFYLFGGVGFPGPSTKPPQGLRSLSLRPELFKREFADWLLSGQTSPHIVSLSLLNINAGEVIRIGRLLNSLANTLEHLTLQVGSYKADLRNGINLSRAIRLRFVHVEEQLYTKRGAYLDWIPTVISQIVSPYLEGVSFRLRMGSRLNGRFSRLDEISWSIMDEALSIHPTIQVVSFDFLQPNLDAVGASRDIVKKHLPKLEAQGLLHFGHSVCVVPPMSNASANPTPLVTVT